MAVFYGFGQRWLRRSGKISVAENPLATRFYAPEQQKHQKITITKNANKKKYKRRDEDIILQDRYVVIFTYRFGLRGPPAPPGGPLVKPD